MGVRQRSGKGVVRRKRMFWRVRFFSALLRFSSVLRANPRRNGLSKNTLLDDHFSARRLRRSFGALWGNLARHEPQGFFSRFLTMRVLSSPRLCQDYRAGYQRKLSWTLTCHFLRGRSLKGSLDKACALTCRFLLTVPTPPPPHPPHPHSPFPSFSKGKQPPATPLNPTPNPFPRDTSGTATPLRKLPPVKTTL